MKLFYFSIICFVFSVHFIHVQYCAKLPDPQNIITTTEPERVKAKNINSVSKAQLLSSSTVSPLPTSTEPILPEWGGNCTKKHWEKCSHLKSWVTTSYINVKKPELGFQKNETDCTIEPALCLRNGWTVTRCQLLCMRCNREILSKYEKYVAKEGKC